MGISIIQSAFVGTDIQAVALSSIIGVTGPDHPYYLVVTAVDREAYTAGATGATGSFVGNGHIDSMSVALASADLESMGIVFSYDGATGQYTNATYGTLSQLAYHPSSSANDMTQISVFATNDQADTVNAANFVTMETGYGATDYVGSATLCTQPGFTGGIPANATPGSVEHAALGFVGRSWNAQGCWILASTIAAEAGASLPASACFSQMPIGGGEWFVAFDGAAAAAGTNWISQVKAGEIIAIPGHITTCVSGSGYGAMLVDNAQTGRNSANDGSASDIVIQKPFPVLSEFFGVAAAGVVIYELDCPSVSALTPTLTAGRTALSALFSATDPHGTAITQFQVYDTVSADHFTVGGRTLSATSAASAITVPSLASVIFQGTGVADSLQVRAENSLGYWGDWQTVSVAAVPAAPAAAPALQAPQAHAVPGQIWKQGQAVDFTLPAGTFADPQNETMTYGATLSDGSALPSWLGVNKATGALSGAAPAGIGTMGIVETATNSSNLSASVTITATGIDAPIVASHQGDVTLLRNQTLSLSLRGEFKDPQGQALNCKATLPDGSALPGWLAFNAATDSLSGNPPANLSASISIEVTATNQSGLDTQDMFMIEVMGASRHFI